MRISDWSSDVCSSDLQMASPSCHISAIGSAVNAMSSQVLNHIHMAIPSCAISTKGSAVYAMSTQISTHIHAAIPSCPISTTGSTMDRSKECRVGKEVCSTFSLRRCTNITKKKE